MTTAVLKASLATEAANRLNGTLILGPLLTATPSGSNSLERVPASATIHHHPLCARRVWDLRRERLGLFAGEHHEEHGRQLVQQSRAALVAFVC